MCKPFEDFGLYEQKCMFSKLKYCKFSSQHVFDKLFKYLIQKLFSLCKKYFFSTLQILFCKSYISYDELGFTISPHTVQYTELFIIKIKTVDSTI